MKKLRLVLVAFVLSAGLVTGCTDETAELNIDPIDVSATDGDNNGGSGQGGGVGDNPPPGNN